MWNEEPNISHSEADNKEQEPVKQESERFEVLERVDTYYVTTAPYEYHVTQEPVKQESEHVVEAIWQLVTQVAGTTVEGEKDLLDVLSLRQQESLARDLLQKKLKIFNDRMNRIWQDTKKDVVVNEQSGVTYIQVKDVSDVTKGLKGSPSIYNQVLSDLQLTVSDKEDISELNERYASLLLKKEYEQLYAGLVSVTLSASRKRDTYTAIPLLFKKAGEKEEPSFSPIMFVQPSIVGASTIVRIEVDEDPLTLEYMGILFSTLTTLTTKYWLLSQGRFADLIEFSKSHDERFIHEAQTVIMRISYNSPLNFDIKLGATDVAQGVVTTIDGIVQTGQRLKQMELANKAKEVELQQAEQRFAEELQHTRQQEAFEQEKRHLELERLRLEVEQQRLALLELRLETQRKSLEHAFEIAHKVIGQLHPHADDTTKRMLVQTYVGDILQLSEISFMGVKVVEVKQALEEKEKKDN